MKRLVAGMVFALGLSAPALGQDLIGWCYEDGGCMGRVPYDAAGYPECESRCDWSNPVPIRGIDAVLVDVTCRGDWGQDTIREMFLRVYERGLERRFVIRDGWMQELVRCNAL